MVKSGKYIEITFVTVNRSIDFVIGGYILNNCFIYDCLVS